MPKMKKDAKWTILFHEEFDKWLSQQKKELQREIWAHIDVLSRIGPNLGRPRVDSVKASDFSNMKEMRIQFQGKPWRVLFAFDPSRSAVLLVGGTKVGKEDWYRVNIPIADERYGQHLQSLKKLKKG